MNIPDSDLPRIVVIGAGFAGLQVAKLTNTDYYQLVLLDKNNYHTFQPLLYQVASAGLEPDSIAYPIRKTLHAKKHTHFRMTDVASVNLDKKLIQTSIGALSYDILVIATGATNNFFNNKSIQEHALPMKSVTDALDLRSKILGNFEKALNTKDLNEREALMNFVIVGAGPTGVELAGALAELKNKILPKDFPDLDLRSMQINLIEAGPRVLGSMAEVSSEKTYKFLKKLGVQVWTETRVLSYLENVVETDNEINFRSNTLIWAAGVKGHLPTGIDDSLIHKSNRLIVNQDLQLKGHTDVFVLGDAGFIQDGDVQNGLPMLASVAKQQGQYLAKRLNQMAKKKSFKQFKYNDQGTMATIGRNKAVVELNKFKTQGVFAWYMWMSVHLMLLVGFRNRVVVFINWLWNYINYNNGLRLIIRPFKKEKL